jgi:hypothetical protein
MLLGSLLRCDVGSLGYSGLHGYLRGQLLNAVTKVSGQWWLQFTLLEKLIDFPCC